MYSIKYINEDNAVKKCFSNVRTLTYSNSVVENDDDKINY